MSKTWEDFKVGQVFVSKGLTLTEAHMVAFAGLTGDFYPLHTNEEYASKTQFKTRIAQGPLVFAIAVGQVIQADAYQDSVIAWLGADNLKFPAPVVPGDTIHVRAEVRAKSETSSEARGKATFMYTVLNQNGQVVLTAELLFLLHRAKRPEEAS